MLKLNRLPMTYFNYRCVKLVSLSPITTRVGQQIKFDSMAHLVVNVDVEPDYLIRIFFGLKRVTGTTSTLIAGYSNWQKC